MYIKLVNEPFNINNLQTVRLSKSGNSLSS